MSTAMVTGRPLAPDTWADFETVMGANGGARGCWCMHWRLSASEWMKGKGGGNKAAMRLVISLTCPLIKKGHRGQGLSTKLIAAVCDYLGETSGTRIVEAYPVEPARGLRAGADNAMTGIASAFAAAGFAEIARPRSDRPVTRYTLL